MSANGLNDRGDEMQVAADRGKNAAGELAFFTCANLHRAGGMKLRSNLLRGYREDGKYKQRNNTAGKSNQLCARGRRFDKVGEQGG